MYFLRKTTDNNKIFLFEQHVAVVHNEISVIISIAEKKNSFQTRPCISVFRKCRRSWPVLLLRQ